MFCHTLVPLIAETKCRPRLLAVGLDQFLHQEHSLDVRKK